MKYKCTDCKYWILEDKGYSNYTTLEASKRLVAAGIVLETDHYWTGISPTSWTITHNKDNGSWESIPAPSMSELWRKLPKREKDIMNCILVMNDWNIKRTDIALLCIEICRDPDKLADLLIWVKGRR